MSSNLIRRYVVVGSRRTSNYIWAIICAIGGIDFLLTGLSSYFNINLLPIIHADNIIFFPQGLVMCFYGLLGILFYSDSSRIKRWFKSSQNYLSLCKGSKTNSINTSWTTNDIRRNRSISC